MQVSLADSIPNEDCLTIEDIAQEFGLSTLRTRQVVDTAVKGKIVPKLFKKDGRRILYTPQMMEMLRKAKEDGKLGKFRNKQSARVLKNATLVINVPIFDQDIANLLKNRFPNEAAMSNYLQHQLEASVKNILAKKQQLEAKYQEELKKLYALSSLDM